MADRRQPDDHRWRWWLLPATAVLVAIRMPDILLQGRFWAEDAKVHFANAWNEPFLHALLENYGGYLDLTANLAGLLADHLAPLEYAPYVTIAFAFVIQLVPAILLIGARDGWLRSPLVLATALIILVTRPYTEEVWLTGIHSKEHLGLATAIILALEPRALGMGKLHHVVLATAPLTGPPAYLLAPLFVVRAILDRSPARAVQAVVISVATSIQLLGFYIGGPRTIEVRPRVITMALFSKQILMPLGGAWAAGTASALHEALVAGRIPPLAYVALGVAGLAGVAGVWLFGRSGPATWLLLAALTSAVGGCIGALGPKHMQMVFGWGDRYSFMPAVLFALCALALAATSRKWARTTFVALTVWLVFIGLLNFRQHSQTGPPWRAEVARWRADSSHPLAIWPEGWFVRLPVK